MSMRCWECQGYVVLPDIVNGEVGKAGMIRANLVDRALVPQTVTIEFNCSKCGSMYIQTTSRLPNKVQKVSDAELNPTDEERRRGWRS